jgi:hypothetical protein
MRRVSPAAALLLYAVSSAACTRPAPSSEARNTELNRPTLPPPDGSRRCVVHLHGKGERGAAPTIVDGLVHLWPDGNGEGWGGRQWLYFPEDRYLEVRRIISDAIVSAGCTRALVHGFSNGASAAASLYCRNETFGGTVSGTIVDDPVPDHGVESCAPTPGAKLRLYVTGALAGKGVAGAACASLDWTCQGGSTIGIDAYARFLGVPIAASSNTTHAPMRAPPEYGEWW